MAQDSNSVERKLLTPNELRYVVCPACYATLCMEAESILCTGCARRYPIVDGLPILLIQRMR
jgi:uncharacterized protein YbaR (Trm112 family)